MEELRKSMERAAKKLANAMPKFPHWFGSSDGKAIHPGYTHVYPDHNPLIDPDGRFSEPKGGR